jgi:hypothetical protein
MYEPGHDWRIAQLEVENAGYVAQAETYRLRAAKAEAALVALIARLDAGGTPADVLADLGVILDEARADLRTRAGAGA